MKKTHGIGFVSVLALVGLGLLGCGEPAVKPEDSMSSTFQKAKQDNPNATPPPPKNSAVKPGDVKPPTASNEAENK